MARKKLIVPAVLAGVAVGAWLGARHLSRTNASTAKNAPGAHANEGGPTEPKPVELHVPRAKSAVPLRAELDQGAWLQATARTNAFVDEAGLPARPYSDARLVWADGNLYVGLYAADEDIVATKKDGDAPLWIEDAFHLAFDVDGPGSGVSPARTRSTIDVSPVGVITDGRTTGAAPVDYGWSSGAKVDVEHDGTPNDPADDDEEWLVALQLPLASLGVEAKPGVRIGFSAHRCDRPKNGARVCGAFGEAPPGVVLVLDD